MAEPWGCTVTVGELKKLLENVDDNLPIYAHWEGQDIKMRESNFGFVKSCSRYIPNHFQIYAEDLYE